MTLDARQMDRAVGTLLGSAAGDALGVPYEYGSRPLEAVPQMRGGGLGGIAPARWSDDTEMACAIAEVACTGADLRTELALDAVADNFLRWYAAGPPDVGNQTRRVLGAVRPGAGSAGRMRQVSAALHDKTGQTAGNGSLMRTAPVALAHFGDTEAIVAAARAVSTLTHHDPVAGDACVLWCLAIDHAVRTGRLDVRVGLPVVDGDYWAPLLTDAERKPPSAFRGNNGWVVSALQGAWSALASTTDLRGALIAAVNGGGDTDTVAAIAGGLAGAAYGGSTVPYAWRRRLHGWPDLRARDLVRMAVLTANGGHPDSQGWSTGEHISAYGLARGRTVPHPDDPGVLLGDVGALRPGVADAVVSLCRLGQADAPLDGVPADDHIEVWLIDDQDANNDLPLVLRDTAEAVRQLRAEGKTVLLHCVHAETRTPVAAAATER